MTNCSSFRGTYCKKQHSLILLLMLWHTCCCLKQYWLWPHKTLCWQILTCWSHCTVDYNVMLVLWFIALEAFYWAAAAGWFCTISNTYNSCSGTICLLFYLLTLLMFNLMSLIRKFSFPPVLICEKVRGQPQGRMGFSLSPATTPFFNTGHHICTKFANLCRGFATWRTKSVRREWKWTVKPPDSKSAFVLIYCP